MSSHKRTFNNLETYYVFVYDALAKEIYQKNNLKTQKLKCFCVFLDV